MAKRATFVVDPDGIIRFAYVTDMSVGRNPQEVLRVLDALQTDELCPCNWQKGEEVFEGRCHKPPPSLRLPGVVPLTRARATFSRKTQP